MQQNNQNLLNYDHLSSNNNNNNNQEYPQYQNNNQYQPQQYLNQQQQQGFQQPQNNNFNNNYDNNGMVQPMMLNNTPQQFQQSVFQNPEQQQKMMVANGLDKLQFMQSAYVRVKQTSGCDDLIICKGFETIYEVFFEAQSQLPAFEIQFNEPSCLQTDIQGSIYSLTYQNPQNPDKQQLYEVEHSRKCCCLKGALTSIPFFGCFCMFFLCVSKCYPSSSQLRQNSKIVSNFKYGFCINQIDITDQGDQKQFSLKTNLASQQGIQQRIYRMHDNNDIEIYGKQIIIQQQAIGRNNYNDNVQVEKLGTLVQFPQNSTIDEKMSLIFAAAKTR